VRVGGVYLSPRAFAIFSSVTACFKSRRIWAIVLGLGTERNWRRNPIARRINPTVTSQGISMFTTAAGRACSQSGHFWLPTAHPPAAYATTIVLLFTQRAESPVAVVMSLKFDDVAWKDRKRSAHPERLRNNAILIHLRLENTASPPRFFGLGGDYSLFSGCRGSDLFLYIKASLVCFYYLRSHSQLPTIGGFGTDCSTQNEAWRSRGLLGCPSAYLPVAHCPLH